MAEAPAQIWHCARCRRPETETGPLQTTPRLLRRPAYLCAKCAYRTQLREGLLVCAVVFLTCVFVWLTPVLFPNGHYQPALLNLRWLQLVLIIFTPLFVLLHEIGHAIAGVLVGYQISEIRLGSGAFVAAPKWLGIAWHFRLYPYGGLCFGYPKKEPATRWQTTWFVLGGPLTNLVLLTLGILLLPGDDGDRSVWWQRLQIPWILIVGNGWSLLYSLLPIFYESEGRRMPNDCLILVELWFGRDALRRFERREDGTTFDLERWPIVRIWIFRILGVGLVLGAIAMLFLSGDYKVLRWLAILPGVFGPVLLWLSYKFRRPNLSEARWNAAENPWPEISAAYYSDYNTLVDGLSDYAEFDEARAQAQTDRERGHGEKAAARFAPLLEKHPHCLSLLLFQFNALVSCGKIDDALERLDRALAIPGLSDGSRVRLEYQRFYMLGTAYRTEDAIASAQRALARPLPDLMRAALLDLMAATTLLPGREEYLPQADGWSAEAMRLSPRVRVRVTRAGVLYESGRDEEAEVILNDVVRKSPDAADYGVAALYLALIAKQRGDKKRSRSLSWTAFRHHPHPWLVERLACDGLATV